MNLRHSLRLLILCLFPALGFARAPDAPVTEADGAAVERSGSWYDPTHDGEGFLLQFIDDSNVVVFWFTYDEIGNQRWFIGSGTASGAVLQVDELLVTEGGVFGPGFDKDAIERIDVGELTITFDADNPDGEALAEYIVDGVAGSQSLIRLTRTVEVTGTETDGIPRKSGSWYDPERDGEGFALELLADGRPVAYWFTYDVDGNQAWMVGIGETSAAQGSIRMDMLQPVGGRFGPNFDPSEVRRDPVGSLRLGLQCEGGFSRYETTDPEDFTDLEANLQRLARIGPFPCSDPQLTNLFPRVEGEVELPDHAAGRQFAWFLDVLGSDGPISDATLRERFADGFLANIGLAQTRQFLVNTRGDYPGARYTDPVSLVPIEVRGVVTAETGDEAFVTLATDLVAGKITNLQVTDYGRDASVVYPMDAALDLEGAADRFASLSAEPGLLLARIDENNVCQPIVARNPDVPRATASIFKIWILAGLADALDERSLFHDQSVPLDGSKQVNGGPLFNQQPGTELTVDELATFMMGVSDNTATDMLLALAGRARIESLHAEYGHGNPSLITPQLGISEQFHLFFSFPLAEAQDYVNGAEPFRRDFLENRIVPLGSRATGGGGFNNESLFIDGSWLASARDVCGAFARHRLHAPGSDAALLVERALQAQVAQPNLRERWDRIWYKGGSLVSGVNGNLVLNHAFLLERKGERPLFLVGMSNEPAGGLDGFLIQSVLGRLLELAAEL